MDPYVGEIKLVPYNFAPQGWAFCDGSLLSIADNEVLFQLIGTTYGGDGQNTYALPDLRGRAIFHRGQGPGLSPYFNGQPGGKEAVALVTTELPAHRHGVRAASAIGTQASPVGEHLAQSPLALGNVYANNPTDSILSPASMAVTGGGGAHQNMQPYLTLNYIICLFGVFPTQ